MKIHFLGGTDEVGASCLLVEMGGQRILIDAGIRVSPKARDGLSGELLPDLSPLSDNPPDAVILTHAHADHIGALPLVFGSFPHIPLYTTPATISIMSVMFRDALRIMDSRSEAEGELPVYDLLQVQLVERACRPADFRQEFSINGKVNVTFYRAGHIPGAASIFLQSDEGSLLVSGDISFSPMRATPIAEIPPVRPDALVLETTYGGKMHANRAAEEQRLIDSVKSVLEEGGRVLIPAFALGRAQEVALILDAAVASKKLPPYPIYLDGMTRSITKVFERFPDYLSKGLQKHMEEEMDLFRSDSVNYVPSAAQRDVLARGTDPCIIIASSGMMTGGASPVYAQHMVANPKNAIFITGYQDEESPGRALQSLANHESNTIYLQNKKVEVLCRVDTYSLSAHADENELTQYAVQLEPKVIYLVHGEHIPRARVRDMIRLRKMAVHLPKIGEVVEFEGSKALGRRKDAPAVVSVVMPPITDLSQLELNLPLFAVDGSLYTANARKMIRRLLPPESGLRKMTFNKNDQSIKFSFDFPDISVAKYQAQIEMVQQLTGWTVNCNDSANMMALNILAKSMLGSNLIGRASIYMPEQVVEVRLKTLPPNWKAIQEQYKAETGFRLLHKGAVATSQTGNSFTEVTPVSALPTANVFRLEINEAYAILKSRFKELGMYKSGLKSTGIVLSFITPEQGAQYLDEIQEVSNQVGYALSIHPHPNQHAIMLLANEMCDERSIYLIKNPSIQVSEQTVTLEPNDPLEEEVMDEMREEFYSKTAWQLLFKAPPAH